MTSSFHLYLNGKRAVLCAARGLWRPYYAERAAWDWQPEDPASLWRQAPAPHGGRSGALHVYVGAALTRLHVFRLPPGAAGRELRAVGGAALANALGLIPGQWHFAVSAAVDGAALACALRAACSEALQQFAAQGGLRLRSVQPLAAAAWNACGPHAAGGTLLLCEEDGMSVLRQHGKGLGAAGAFAHQGEGEVLARERRRLALDGSTGQLHIIATQAFADGVAGMAGTPPAWSGRALPPCTGPLLDISDWSPQ